jgi:uridylate kinase
MGRPYFSTDTAAVQRALEIGAQVVLKGTRVDGVYDKDPEEHPNARLYDAISFNEAIAKDLRILDPTAFTLCRDNNLPVVVFNVHKAGAFSAAIRGEKVGTLVNAAGER